VFVRVNKGKYENKRLKERRILGWLGIEWTSLSIFFYLGKAMAEGVLRFVQLWMQFTTFCIFNKLLLADLCLV